jgi:hypothetical protein
MVVRYDFGLFSQVENLEGDLTLCHANFPMSVVSEFPLILNLNPGIRNRPDKSGSHR